MTDFSDRFALPLLNAGQAQKELYHNEALARLDMLAHAAVEDHGINTPPGSPAPGQCWIIGASPTGDWAGHANALAGWTSGGWRFSAPRAGMTVWDVTAGCWLRHDGSGWIIGSLAATRVEVGGVQVVGARAAAIADPAGGATADNEARSAIGQILGALRAHGLIAP